MTRSWMLYGAAGYTGTLIAKHAVERGHRPLLAGRSAPAIAALAEELELPYRVLALDDPAAVLAALLGVDLVLNAAGPFLRTAAPLVDACLNSGVHYLDIGNELQVYRALYDLNERAQRAGVSVIPGVGFGVVATNCLARFVNDAVGGADRLEVASRIACAQAGPGAAATMRENLPFGGWARQNGRLEPQQLFSQATTIVFPDGPHRAVAMPTGDLEAAFRATGAPNVVAYSVQADPAALEAKVPDGDGAASDAYRSFGWAKATGPDGATVEALVQTGDSYAFTAASSVRAVEEVLGAAAPGASSPATAFGVDFPLSIPGTSRTDTVLY